MESSSTLKLPLFSVQATMESPEHTGMLTPPIHALASVPFLWEQEPGKPHPCSHLIPLPNSIFNEPKCLDPPPRLLYLTTSSSPTTVLQGPYITAKSSSSSSSFSFFDNNTIIKKSSETGQVISTFVLDKKKLQSREWWRVTVKRRGGKVNRDCGSECSGSTVKMARLGRNGSFSNLSQARSHIWAAIYQGFRQVIPWKTRKSKKEVLIL